MPTVLLLVAALLRFAALGQAERFHPDEALFATFARAAALNGEWLLPGALDKPPLSIYSTALSMALLVNTEAAPGLPDIHPRTGELAARLPNLFISLIVVALGYRLALRLYASRRVALLALALITCSPFAIAFAPTAFTDGWMLAALAAALTAMAGGRWGWAGLWLGVAVWSKQQALFYLPLLAALGWLLETRPNLWRRGVAFAAPLASALVLLALWDAARAQPVSVLALASANNAPWRLLRSDEVWPRLAAWYEYGSWLLGVPVLTVAMTALAGLVATVSAVRQPRVRHSAVDLLLVAFIVAYVGLHWLVAFNVYDRYLLLILLPMALLAARGIDAIAPRSAPAAPRWLAAALAITLVFGGLQAARGRPPIGADRGEHTRIDHAAAFLNSRALGAIIYDYWLGWELDYYLGQWSDKRRVYYPSTGALVADATRQPDPAPRYFIAPVARSHAPWLEALASASFSVTEVYHDGHYVIYELHPPWATD